MPVIVPQVPRLATKWVILPSVWRQISGPVVRKWASGLASLAYWSSRTKPGSRAAVSRATAIDPSGAPGAGQSESSSSWTSAPKNRRTVRFSSGIAAGKRRAQRVALGVAHHGQAQPRVAGGGLHEALAGRQRAARLGIADQVGGDAVLDRAEGIVPLKFGINSGVPEGHDAVQPDQRSRVFLPRKQVQDCVINPGRMITCHFGESAKLIQNRAHRPAPAQFVPGRMRLQTQNLVRSI